MFPPDLLLVFLHLYWNFLCGIRIWNLMPLKFPLAIMVAITISALLFRIQGCSLCKDKQINGEVRGQFLLISLIHCMSGIRDAAEALLGLKKPVIEFRKAILMNTA